MENFLEILAAFLGGGLLSTLIFIFTFYARISTMSNNIEHLTTALDNHIKLQTPVCPMHTTTVTDLAVLKAEVSQLKDRIYSQD